MRQNELSEVTETSVKMTSIDTPKDIYTSFSKWPWPQLSTSLTERPTSLLCFCSLLPWWSMVNWMPIFIRYEWMTSANPTKMSNPRPTNRRGSLPLINRNIMSISSSSTVSEQSTGSRDAKMWGFECGTTVYVALSPGPGLINHSQCNLTWLIVTWHFYLAFNQHYCISSNRFMIISWINHLLIYCPRQYVPIECYYHLRESIHMSLLRWISLVFSTSFQTGPLRLFVVSSSHL